MKKDYKNIITELMHDAIFQNECNDKAYKVVQEYQKVIDDIIENQPKLAAYIRSNGNYDLGKALSYSKTHFLIHLEDYRFELSTEKAKKVPNNKAISALEKKIEELSQQNAFYLNNISPILRKYGTLNLMDLNKNYLHARRILNKASEDAAERIFCDANNRDIISAYLYDTILNKASIEESDSLLYQKFNKYIKSTKLTEQYSNDSGLIIG